MSDYSLLLESPPPGWTPARFGDICNRVQDAASPSANGERLYLGLEHLASGHPALVGRGKESDVRSGKTEFHKRDVLFGKLRPYLRKSVLVSQDGICSTDILVFRATEKCIPEFLCLLTHTDEFVGHAKATTSGVQHPRTSWAGLRDLRLHVPPLPEQRKIAAVLGMVQRAIEQQERLLQLTAELKKTLLQQLFTQGLRGEPQKQTEIGPVPESWEIVPLSDGVSIKKGQVDPKVTPFREMIHVGPENIESHTGRLLNLRSNSELRISSGNYHFTNDDILYSKIRPYLNKVAFPNFEGTCSADMYPLRPKDGQFVRGFLFQLLLSDPFNKQAVSHQDRTGIPKINRVQLGAVLLPKPLLSEQVDIAESLALIDQRIDQLQRKHVALSELFRTLLHQLMTAQIRVYDLDLLELGQCNEAASEM